MLIGIPPSLPPDLLHVLASMGHGDELVVCDANFPAWSVATGSWRGEPIELGAGSASEVIRHILALMPLDAFEKPAAWCMEVPGRHVGLPAVQSEVQRIISAEIAGAPWSLGKIDRFSFYERAAGAFAVVRTQERRPYGCFIFTKGALTAEGELMTPELANRV